MPRDPGRAHGFSMVDCVSQLSGLLGGGIYIYIYIYGSPPRMDLPFRVVVQITKEIKQNQRKNPNIFEELMKHTTRKKDC